MAKPKRLNDTDRDQWIDNDETLYHWYITQGLSRRDFIRAHRFELDQHINAVLSKSPREKTWRDYA